MKRWSAALALSLAAVAAHAMPSEIAAEYRVTNLGVTIGRVSETFQRDGDRYAIRSVSRSEGVLKLVLDDNLTLESRGRIVPEGLQPLEFEQRRAGNHSKDVHATFDWDKGIMHSRFRGERRDIPLPRATQDRISILYQFMNLEKGGRQVEMHMSNGRKVERYTYRFMGEARLDTPAGEFDTLHYQRVTSDALDARTDVWLAKDRYNLPVRVIFDDPRGLKVEQTLLDLKVR
jgi:hypothetical protein